MKLAHMQEVNCGPRSLTMSPGILKYWNTWLKRSSAIVQAEGKPGSAISGRDLVKRSMTTKTVVLPQDSGRLVRKLICDQGNWGVDRSLPVGRVLQHFDLGASSRGRYNTVHVCKYICPPLLVPQ